MGESLATPRKKAPIDLSKFSASLDAAVDQSHSVPELVQVALVSILSSVVADMVVSVFKREK